MQAGFHSSEINALNHGSSHSHFNEVPPSCHQTYHQPKSDVLLSSSWQPNFSPTPSTAVQSPDQFGTQDFVPHGRTSSYSSHDSPSAQSSSHHSLNNSPCPDVSFTDFDVTEGRVTNTYPVVEVADVTEGRVTNTYPVVEVADVTEGRVTNTYPVVEVADVTEGRVTNTYPVVEMSNPQLTLDDQIVQQLQSSCLTDEERKTKARIANNKASKLYRERERQKRLLLAKEVKKGEKKNLENQQKLRKLQREMDALNQMIEILKGISNENIAVK